MLTASCLHVACRRGARQTIVRAVSVALAHRATTCIADLVAAITWAWIVPIHTYGPGGIGVRLAGFHAVTELAVIANNRRAVYTIAGRHIAGLDTVACIAVVTNNRRAGYTSAGRYIAGLDTVAGVAVVAVVVVKAGRLPEPKTLILALIRIVNDDRPGVTAWVRGASAFHGAEPRDRHRARITGHPRQ